MKHRNNSQHFIAALIIVGAGLLLACPTLSRAAAPDGIEAPAPPETAQPEKQIRTRIIKVGDEDIDIDIDEVLDGAHEELERALEKIKLHHLEELPEKFRKFEWISDTQRPRMGIIFKSSIGESPQKGLSVIGVSPGSPAEEAGISAGDIVTKIDELELKGDPESGLEKVLEHLEVLKPGDPVHLVFLRDDKVHEVDLKLRESEGKKNIKMLFLGDEDRDFNLPDIEKSFTFFGKNDLDLELASLNEDLGEYFGTSEGVLVLDISKENSLGLRAGDVIQSIGGRELRGPEHAFRIFRSYEADEEMNLEIIRHGKKMKLKGIKK